MYNWQNWIFFEYSQSSLLFVSLLSMLSVKVRTFIQIISIYSWNFFTFQLPQQFLQRKNIFDMLISNMVTVVRWEMIPCKFMCLALQFEQKYVYLQIGLHRHWIKDINNLYITNLFFILTSHCVQKIDLCRFSWELPGPSTHS